MTIIHARMIDIFVIARWWLSKYFCKIESKTEKQCYWEDCELWLSSALKVMRIMERRKKSVHQHYYRAREREMILTTTKKRQCFFLQTRLVHDCNLKGISMFKKIYNTFVLLLLLLYKLPAAIFLKKQKQTLPILYRGWLLSITHWCLLLHHYITLLRLSILFQQQPFSCIYKKII